LTKLEYTPLRLSDHLNVVETLQDFFPDNLQLQFGKPDSDAAVNAEAEREVLAGPRPSMINS